jgi:hypothetical protein
MHKNIVIILGESIVNQIWGESYDYLVSIRIFTLIMSKIFI